MRLTRLITLGFLGPTTASVINPQARYLYPSVTVPNNTTTNSTSSLQPSTLSSDSPVISHPSPPSPPVANVVDDNVAMIDFDEEDQNENTQRHGGHGGGHGGHGRGHSRGTGGHTGASGGADGSHGGGGGAGGGGAAVGAGGSANGKKSDGGRLRVEMLGVVGMVMMGLGVVVG